MATEGTHLLGALLFSTLTHLICLSNQVSASSIESFTDNQLKCAVELVSDESEGKLLLGPGFGKLIVKLDKKAHSTLDAEVDDSDEADSDDDSDYDAGDTA